MCALLYYSEESMFHIDTRRGATNERKLERGLYTAYGQLRYGIQRGIHSTDE